MICRWNLKFTKKNMDRNKNKETAESQFINIQLIKLWTVNKHTIYEFVNTEHAKWPLMVEYKLLATHWSSTFIFCSVVTQMNTVRHLCEKGNRKTKRRGKKTYAILCYERTHTMTLSFEYTQNTCGPILFV